MQKGEEKGRANAFPNFFVSVFVCVNYNLFPTTCTTKRLEYRGPWCMVKSLPNNCEEDNYALTCERGHLKYHLRGILHLDLQYFNGTKIASEFQIVEFVASAFARHSVPP